MLQVGRELWGIQVKSGRDARSDWFSGFESLASNVRTLKWRIVVFLGARSQRAKGVEIPSLKDFLAELPTQ